MTKRCVAVMELANTFYDEYLTHGDLWLDATEKSLVALLEFISCDVLLNKNEKNDMRIYVKTYLLKLSIKKADKLLAEIKAAL